MMDTTKKNSAALIRVCWFILFCATVTQTQLGLAEDRALLVGVGNFRSPDVPNLPGIDLDIEMMRQSAVLMGFKDSNIKILMDGQATLSNVTYEFENWLINGVSPGDRTFFFFSGHGTSIPDRNGDEADKADEVLVMHDAALETLDGRQTVTGVLVDDQFGMLLSKAPASETYVFIDACHSGTATKSWIGGGGTGSGEAQSKFFRYPGMPQTTKGSFSVATDNTAEARSDMPKGKYVAVAAAGDDEEAIATSKGSLFTLIVHDLIEEASTTGQPITPSQIQKTAAEKIRQKKQEPESNFALFQPILTGDETLANKPIRLQMAAMSNSAHGTKWQQLEALAAKGSILNISANQPSYKIGDRLEMNIEVDQPGYLNVINIDTTDEGTILFPNKWHPDNQVQAGRLSIPTEEMKAAGAYLNTGEPFGDNLILVILTNEPLNLYRSESGKGMSFQALTNLGVGEMKAVSTRSFQATAGNSNNGYKAGKILTKVCRSESEC